MIKSHPSIRRVLQVKSCCRLKCLLQVFCGCGCADAAAAAAADGYSRVDHVASLSSSAAIHVTNPSAVYAVVSRNRTAPSQTNSVRVSSSIGSPADSSVVAGAATADARRDLYTQVIRRQDGRRASPLTGQSSTTEPSRSADLSADGYARIDDPLPAPQQQQNDNNVDFYDVIGDDLSVNASLDFDPNYESVPQTTAAPVSAASSSVNGVAGSSSSSVNVAADSHRRHDSAASASVLNNSGSGRQSDAARHHGLLIREHIYDEVSSPKTRSSTTSTNRHSDV